MARSSLSFAVVGGGIAGLAAAWDLRHAGEVTVFEPGPLGGCIRTSPFEGHPVDEGPDAFLTRVPDAVQLCRELGLEDELVAPGAGGSAIWVDGRLRRLPESLVLGVPRNMTGLIRSRILSPAGTARAALDLVLPRRRSPGGLSVRDLVADRFGSQVADRLVDPLVGGIHAGWTGELGAAEVMPQLVVTAEESRSLLLGLRKTAPGPAGPIFLAPRLGVGRLVDVLVSSLEAGGVRFIAEAAAHVRSASKGRVVIEPGPDHFDAAVVALPPSRAAHLLGQDGGIEALASVPTASVTVVVMSLPGIELPPDLNGFLVPRSEKRLMTACSFASNKWPHWADSDRTVVRVSAGRHGDRRALELDDEALVDRLIDELSSVLGRSVSPGTTRVSRWPDAFPQYRVGHGALVTAVEQSVLRRYPRIALAGSAYRGSGIPACIASGRGAARLTVERTVSVDVT
jgi:oxygen-dependent protoporphyrinogen oxidase